MFIQKEKIVYRKKIITLLLITLGLSLSTMGYHHPSSTSQDEIERINLEIAIHGLRWRAVETSISRLAPEERRQRLGEIAPLFEDPSQFAEIREITQLPDALDWRSKNECNYMTTVKSQGSCGSCWAFCVVGIMEALYNVETGNFSIQPITIDFNVGTTATIASRLGIQALSVPDISEQDLVSCSSAGTCDGGSSSSALGHARDNGIVSEDCFPYKAADVSCVRCPNWNMKLARIKGWGYVTQSTEDVTLVKTALQDGPLSFYMEVFDDFYHYQSGIYQKTANAEYEGGHAVVLVGYDESQDCWICKNSWGTDWGEDGYFKIKRGECQGGLWVRKAWGVSLNNKPPVLAPIANQSVKEDQELRFTVTASDPEDDTLAFSATPLPAGAYFNSSSGEFRWTPTHTQSGDYDVLFSVSDGLFERSQQVRITVINVKKGKGKF